MTLQKSRILPTRRITLIQVCSKLQYKWTVSWSITCVFINSIFISSKLSGVPIISEHTVCMYISIPFWCSCYVSFCLVLSYYQHWLFLIVWIIYHVAAFSFILSLNDIYIELFYNFWLFLERILLIICCEIRNWTVFEVAQIMTLQKSRILPTRRITLIQVCSKLQYKWTVSWSITCVFINSTFSYLSLISSCCVSICLFVTKNIWNNKE